MNRRVSDNLLSGSPWFDIKVSSRRGEFNSQRVDAFSSVPLYWTRDFQGLPGVLLKLPRYPAELRRRPRLRELEVTLANKESPESFVVLTLLEPTQQSSFRHFSMGLLAALSKVEEPHAYYDVTINYLWQWHRFLRGKIDPFNSDAQRGLLAELYFLATVLSARLGWESSVKAWSGPYGSIYDFGWDRHLVEIKSVIAGGTSKVKISSADQLQVPDKHDAWLVVANLQKSTESGLGWSIDDYISYLRSTIAEAAPAVIDELDSKLTASGYIPVGSEERERWDLTTLKVFEVLETFPSIRLSDTARAIEDVKYSLRVDLLSDFSVESSDFERRVFE